MSASSRRSHVSSSRSPWNSVAWTSACSASRVLRMFSRMRRKKPRRSSARSVSAGAPAGRPPSTTKRSNQSRAIGGAAYSGRMPEPVSVEELQLATRNHGMPLEALRWDVTPVGMHYLLVHYDVPAVELASWRLEVQGRRALSLSLDDL